MKILKVFSLVIVLHMALVILLVMQPGCNSVSNKTTTAQMATPMGDSTSSGLWVTKSSGGSKTRTSTAVVASRENLNSNVNASATMGAYSESDMNDTFVDLSGPEVATASVYTESNDSFEYTIKKGDSLWAIATANGVSMKRLMELNRLKKTDRIHPGQTLMIPGIAKPSVALANLETPVVEAADTTTVFEPESTLVADVETPVIANSESIPYPESGSSASVSDSGIIEGIYEVQPGDSLYLIAMHHNTTLKAIRELNGLSKNLIRPGQKIRIPGKYNGPAIATSTEESMVSFADAFNDVPVQKVSSSEYLEHTVQPGEYPGLIARKYNMSLADLLHINEIRNPRMLRVGATLKVINPEAMVNQGAALAVDASREKSSEEAVATHLDEDIPTIEVDNTPSNPVDFADVDFPVIRVGS